MSKKKKVNIWIYSDRGDGLNLTISRAQLYLCTFFVAICVILVGSSGIQSLLETPFVEDIFARQNQTRDAFHSTSQLDEKIKILSEEYVRLHKLQSELKQRASFLKAIIGDVDALDFNFSTQTENSTAVDLHISDDLARGGSDEGLDPRLDLVAEPVGFLGTSLSRKKDVDFIKDIDSLIDTLKNVPLGVPVLGRITSGFGFRHSPFTRRFHKHRGIDLAVERSSIVLATADGIVVEAGRKGDYGNTVMIDHGNGIETLYGHLAEISVSVGRKICRGESLGQVGSTGRSTGPHLHYEVRVDGIPKNPNSFIQLASFLKLIS